MIFIILFQERPLLLPSVHMGHMSDQGYEFAGISPFIVIPGDQLDEMIVEADTGFSVEDAGVGVGADVGGNQFIGVVLDDAFHVGVGCFLDSFADPVVGRRLFQLGGQVNNRTVIAGNAEAHARHLSFE